MRTRSVGGWSNWCGLEQVVPRRAVVPRSSQDVLGEVRAARERGGSVRMPGSGHSFTGVAVAEDTMLRPEALRGQVVVDPARRTATAPAGTPLHQLNAELAEAGWSLHNMGDIDRQTVAGAVSTGTHGTGGQVASLAAQLAGVELVTGTGELLLVDADTNADLLDAVRLSLGALGVLTSLTFRIEPLFVIEAHEQPMTWDRALASYDELAAAVDHVDMYWFPHTDRTMVKQNRHVDIPVGQARPPSRLAAWREDELLSNHVFGAVTWLASRVPAVVPVVNQVSGRALSERSYSDVAHRVFTTPRRVVFKEMEYAVPREVGLEALRECRRRIERSRWRVSFPVEIRNAPADDLWLSTAHGRDVLYLAFHIHRDADHRDYFAGIEEIMLAHGGRPHWGKLHSLDAARLAEVYPRFAEFLALRDRLDPDRVFANPHLRRLLGG